MSKEDPHASDDDVLKGTTLRVYKFIFKEGNPVRNNEVQRALRLSSPYLAQYHISKLLRAGLIKESENGYTVDRVLFGNLVRVRRMVVPFSDHLRDPIRIGPRRHAHRPSPSDAHLTLRLCSGCHLDCSCGLAL